MCTELDVLSPFLPLLVAGARHAVVQDHRTCSAGTARVRPWARFIRVRSLVPTFVTSCRRGWRASRGTRGDGIPSLTPVGYFRFEDPDGEVGVETHLVSDGLALYQVPMTYRGTPVNDVPAAGTALITTAEHSVLGTRWIYDGQADPVWHSAMLRLVQDGGVSDPSSKAGWAQRWRATAC